MRRYCKDHTACLLFFRIWAGNENYIRYIPNTSGQLPDMCGEGFPSQAYLVCINTGELYELDLFEKGANPDTGEYGYTSMSFWI